MMGREEVPAVEERSQCSSGCLSGWTLYLEHSGDHLQQCCSLPHHADAHRQMLLRSESDEEDSMVSDASSGPSPNRLPEEEEPLQGQSKLQQRRRVLGGYGVRRSTSGSGSRSFGSNRSCGLGQVMKSRKRRAAVRDGEEAMRRRHGVDQDDLDDTASSSAVASTDVVEVMRRGGDGMDDSLQPKCAFSRQHYSPDWSAVLSRSIMQSQAMLHQNWTS